MQGLFFNKLKICYNFIKNICKQVFNVMEMIDNITKTIKDDLKATIQPKSKVSIAAACFSIYAYQELKKSWRKLMR